MAQINNALTERDTKSPKDFFDSERSKNLLRFITCGSVDDGKSTLIGRLLYESNLILEDQMEALVHDSKKFGTTNQELDLALLVDGLVAEREQGITIDVAYRFFSTPKRKFIIADTPGHEQYTRNMATGASTADLAIIIVDARKGILTQTKRHSFIVAMLGVKNIVLAINKMDLVNYDCKTFQQIERDYKSIAKFIGIKNIFSIPISALQGDNVVCQSEQTSWYEGSCLLEYLEAVDVEQENTFQAFRMPIQWVNRPNLDFRGFAGKIVSGSIRIDDEIIVLPAGKSSTVTQIITYDEQLKEAGKDQSITLTLKDEIDISRGDVIVLSKEALCNISDKFVTNIIWMSDKGMVPNRQYVIQLHTDKTLCTLKKPEYRLNVDTFEHIACKTLLLNEIGVCEIFLNKFVVFEEYITNKEMGSFILIDRVTHETVAAGMIIHALRRSANIHEQPLSISLSARALIKQQKACILWMTGLSGAGKSTIANMVEEKLNIMNKHTMILDGDNVRLGLNKDLGFTEQDRIENIRRVAEVSKLMADAGLIVLVSLISPFEAEREMARNIIGNQQFIEIFVDTDLATAEIRDVKGLYKKARAGEIPNFTGINSPYEPPSSPDIILDTKYSSEQLTDKIIYFLKERGFLS
jgi:bifunctional enzyme CysN/CysC